MSLQLLPSDYIIKSAQCNTLFALWIVFLRRLVLFFAAINFYLFVIDCLTETDLILKMGNAEALVS